MKEQVVNWAKKLKLLIGIPFVAALLSGLGFMFWFVHESGEVQATSLEALLLQLKVHPHAFNAFLHIMRLTAKYSFITVFAVLLLKDANEIRKINLERRKK